MATAARDLPSANPVTRLGAVCRTRGLNNLATRLGGLEAWIADDMRYLKAELALLPCSGSVARLGAGHQLDLGGKLLRPMCVALAAKLGKGFGSAACHVAVAVELIHNATLLHDDVIDLAEQRRGAQAVRVIYGNTASVLAGDWLLVKAFNRIQRCEIPGLFERALATLETMIDAEAHQFENRGRANLGRADYYSVIDGKTSALFRFAMFAGAKAGGLSADHTTALERFGGHLGVAFQLIDDLLDFSGDPAVTGKAIFNDLREGKMTYPLLLALERDASCRRVVEQLLDRPVEEPLPPAQCDLLRQGLETTSSLKDCRVLARKRAERAIACLSPIPDGPARTALSGLALAAVEREK